MGERFSLHVTDEQKAIINELYRISHATPRIPGMSKAEITRFLLEKSIEQIGDGGLTLAEAGDGEPITVAELFDEYGHVDLAVLLDDVDRGDGLATDGGVDDERVSSDAAVARATDGDGTAYTVAAVDLASHPALDAIGFPDGTRQFIVLTDGGDVVAAGYDRHKIARETGERWLHDAFDRLNHTLDTVDE